MNFNIANYKLHSGVRSNHFRFSIADSVERSEQVKVICQMSSRKTATKVLIMISSLSLGFVLDIDTEMFHFKCEYTKIYFTPFIWRTLQLPNIVILQ